MKSISLDITKAVSFLKAGTVEAYEPQVKAAQESLENCTFLHLIKSVFRKHMLWKHLF